jgi:site-specific DNA-methyltransferase (adenine-specific)
MPAEPARPAIPRAAGRARRPTRTAAFGSGRRESHDASEFYGRFVDPVVSADDEVRPPVLVDRIVAGDARELLATDRYVADKSVALLVTSPPYFAGKEYEEALGTGHVPGSYKEYLAMVRDVLGAGVAKLEPGGRMAINVANLGRKPYRSLAADIITILQDDLQLLLRGEIVWQKALGAGGSVAWGSFQSPANPVLRDVTERVIVASKGRFDRAVDRPARARRGLPHEASIDIDRFMDATTDVWEIAPESATRVGHPAPFPVELPAALIDLYTYVGDLVLDPFMGSGTTAVAALERGRRFIGFDTDPAYVAAAEARVAAAAARARRARRVSVGAVGAPAPPAPTAPSDGAAAAGDEQARLARAGRKAKDIAAVVVAEAGFVTVETDVKLAGGLTVDFACTDREGRTWYLDLTTALSSIRSGLRRTDAVWKAIARAALTARPADADGPRWVLLTTEPVAAASPAGRALAQARAQGFVHDALDVYQRATVARLSAHARGEAPADTRFFPVDRSGGA